MKPLVFLVSALLAATSAGTALPAAAFPGTDTMVPVTREVQPGAFELTTPLATGTSNSAATISFQSPIATQPTSQYKVTTGIMYVTGAPTALYTQPNTSSGQNLGVAATQMVITTGNATVSQGQTWFEVRLGSTTGWVPYRDLVVYSKHASYAKIRQGLIYTLKKDSVLLDAAATGATPLATLSTGTNVETGLHKVGSYWQVRRNGVTGWVPIADLRVADFQATSFQISVGNIYLTARPAPMRTEASLSAGTVRNLPATDMVVSTGRAYRGIDGAFYEVRQDGVKGWMKQTDLVYYTRHASYSKITPRLIYGATTKTPLRTIASANGQALAWIPAGALVTTGNHKAGSYWQVTYNGKTGWVLIGHLKSDPLATARKTGALTSQSQPWNGNGVFTTANLNTSPEPGTGRVVRVRFQTEGGLAVDRNLWAHLTLDILNNPRGWGGPNNSIRFVATTGTADVTVRLTSPATVDRLCYPLDTGGYTSCSKGSQVIINVNRWAYGAAPFNNAGGTVVEYRNYVINHEMGHSLGKGHQQCPGRGRLAPVMQQQTLYMSGCLPNGWPY